MANQMTDERREELIEIVFKRWTEAKTPEDRADHWDEMKLLIEGRTDRQVRKLEQQRGLR